MLRCTVTEDGAIVMMTASVRQDSHKFISINVGVCVSDDDDFIKCG